MFRFLKDKEPKKFDDDDDDDDDKDDDSGDFWSGGRRQKTLVTGEEGTWRKRWQMMLVRMITMRMGTVMADGYDDGRNNSWCHW